MCGIVGSSDHALFLQLMGMIQERGTIGGSVSLLDRSGVLFHHFTFDGSYNPNKYQTPPVNCFMVGHVLSPTGTTKTYHPAVGDNKFLWHNGMMDPAYEKQLGYPTKWDTQALVWDFDKRGSTALEEYQGSMACVTSSSVGLSIFRNHISPLWINPESGSFSSLCFPYADRLPAGQIWQVLPEVKRTGYFKNTYDPFGISQEQK